MAEKVDIGGHILKRTSSIQKRIVFIVLVNLLALLLAIIMSLLVRINVTTRAEILRENNRVIVQLPMQINNCKRYFSEFTNGQLNAQMYTYLETSQIISESLTYISENIELDRQGGTYLRIIKTMHGYQEEKIKELILKSPNMDHYEDIVFLKQVFTEMNNTAQLLTVSYMNKSTLEEEALLNRTAEMPNTLIAFLSVIMLITLGINIYIMRDILVTIKYMEKASKELEQNRWQVEDLRPSKYVELNQVSHAFNEMKHALKNHLEDIRIKNKLALELKEAQLKYLQMQINPHFLFNTLNLIGKTALLKRVDLTMDLIEHISVILRFGMDNTENMVALEKELECVESYMFIQSVRFQDRIDFSMEVAPNLEDVQIPPMIIQPLIENAVKHGFHNQTETGELRLFIYEDDKKQVVIDILDNGKGFNTDDIIESQGIGILNVRKRLNLSFNRENLLIIESKQGEGTHICITIPRRENHAKANNC